MRYQNPLFSLVTQAPLSPRGRARPVQPGRCAAVCPETDENCSQCQKLAEDVRRLMKEKQELLVDLINTNQAFMRLQNDHTALLQRVAGINVPKQQQSDAAQATDTSNLTEQQRQQHKQDGTAAFGADLSAQVSSLLDPHAAAALPPGPTPISTAAVDGTTTPRIEPSSPPVKRKRARWDKSAQLRDSFKSLGGLLSSRGATSSSTATASQTAPSSPNRIMAPRSPKAFSRLRRSLQIFSPSSSNAAGSSLTNTAEPLLPSSSNNSSVPIIDVGALTQINGRTQAAGLQTLPCVSSTSGSGGTAGVGPGGKAPSRSSLDGSAAATFSRSISSKAGFNLNKLAGRHSVDCSSSSSSKDRGLLPSAAALSTRTRRSASFLAGSFSRTFPHSPKRTAVQLPLPGSPTCREAANKDVDQQQQQQPAVPTLPGSRYQHSSLQSDNDSSNGKSCDSHRLTSCVESEAGSILAASQAGGSNGRSSNTTNNSSTSTSTFNIRTPRPSHLRPLSPKSRALKDLASPTTPAGAAADSPRAAPAVAATAAGHTAVPTAAPAAPAFADAAAEPTTGPAPSVPAAPASAAAPRLPTSSAAAAVAELLLPFSTPASRKVKFLRPVKRGKQAPVSTDGSSEPTAASPSAAAATGSPRAYFGRVWDKWHIKAARTQEAQAEETTEVNLDAAAVEPAPATEAAATAVCVLATLNAGDAAAAADCGAAAGVTKAAAFLAAWPLDFEAELDFEGGISSRPSLV